MVKFEPMDKNPDNPNERAKIPSLFDNLIDTLMKNSTIVKTIGDSVKKVKDKEADVLKEQEKAVKQKSKKEAKEAEEDKKKEDPHILKELKDTARKNSVIVDTFFSYWEEKDKDKKKEKAQDEQRQKAEDNIKKSNGSIKQGSNAGSLAKETDVQRIEKEQEKERENQDLERRHDELLESQHKSVDNENTIIKLLKTIIENQEKGLNGGDNPQNPNFEFPDFERNRKNKQNKNKVNSQEKTQKTNSIEKTKKTPKPAKNLPKPTNMVKGAGKFSNFGSKALNLLRTGGTKIPLAGALIQAGLSAYDGFSAYNDDEAIKSQTGKDEVTTGDRIKHAVGGVLAGVANTANMLNPLNWFADTLDEKGILSKDKNPFSEKSASDVVDNLEGVWNWVTGDGFKTNRQIEQEKKAQEQYKKMQELEPEFQEKRKEHLQKHYEEQGLSPMEAQIAVLRKQNEIANPLNYSAANHLSIKKYQKQDIEGNSGEQGASVVSSNTVNNNYNLDTTNYRVTDESTTRLSTIGG